MAGASPLLPLPSCLTQPARRASLHSPVPCKPLPLSWGGQTGEGGRARAGASILPLACPPTADWQQHLGVGAVEIDPAGQPSKVAGQGQLGEGGSCGQGKREKPLPQGTPSWADSSWDGGER